MQEEAPFCAFLVQLEMVSLTDLVQNSNPPHILQFHGLPCCPQSYCILCLRKYIKRLIMHLLAKMLNADLMTNCALQIPETLARWAVKIGMASFVKELTGAHNKC